MKNSNLNKIFKPASIAVIGASEKPGSIGLALVKNLQAGHYQGRLFPVNPNHRTINGLKAFASVADILNYTLDCMNNAHDKKEQ